MSDCISSSPCPCDSLPVTAYDGSAPQVETFIATGYAAVVPPLGMGWNRLSCMMFTASPVSQEAADFTAQQQAQLCAFNSVSPYGPESGPGGGGSGGGGGTPVGAFFNSPQECTATCADGLPFIFQVPAGAFSGTSQAAADTAAKSYACAQAQARIICLSALTPPTFTVNTAYSGTITATGASLAGPGQVNLWELVAGVLPTGLTFNGGLTQASSATITGTPTVGGVYTFTVRCTDPLGDTMTKTYTLTCAVSQAVVTNTWTFINVDGGTCNQSTIVQTGFQSAAPEAGYDTAYHSIQNACGNYQTCGGGTVKFFLITRNDLVLDFTSGLSKTWNLKVVMTLSGTTANTGYFIKIDGTVQSGWSVVGNVATWIGTFTTAGCVDTQIAVEGFGNVNLSGAGCVETLVEWLTPA